MDLFRLDPGLAIWTWVTFGGLCLILAKWVLPRLLGSLEKRERLIAKSVDDALALEERLKALDQERLSVLARARLEGEGLVEEARREAEALRQELLDRASNEAEALVAEGRQRVTEERRAAIEALRGELAEFALACAETVVGAALVGEREREWARERARQL
jgi:F-type H+-transporting ATPase subunit b